MTFHCNDVWLFDFKMYSDCGNGQWNTFWIRKAKKIKLTISAPVFYRSYASWYKRLTTHANRHRSSIHYRGFFIMFVIKILTLEVVIDILHNPKNQFLTYEDILHFYTDCVPTNFVFSQQKYSFSGMHRIKRILE